MNPFNGKFIQYQFQNTEAPEWLLDRIKDDLPPSECTDILFTGSKFLNGWGYDKANGKSDWDIVAYGPRLVSKIVLCIS